MSSFGCGLLIMRDVSSRAERAMAVVRELRGRVRTGGRKFTRDEMNER